MKTIAKIFLEAASLIENNGWCQNSYAKDKLGEAVSPVSKNACCYCISGAIWRAAGVKYSSAWRVMVSFIQQEKNCAIHHFNDIICSNQNEAIAILRKAADFNEF